MPVYTATVLIVLEAEDKLDAEDMLIISALDDVTKIEPIYNLDITTIETTSELP